jgi:plastocyanin
MPLFKRSALGALAAALILSSAPAALAQSPVDDPAAMANVVLMQGNQFLPAEYQVPLGMTVTWVNLDGEEHDVLPADWENRIDPTFESPLIAPGGSWSFTFTIPGTYGYFCDLHANMVGVIIVTEGQAVPAAEVPPAEAVPVAEEAPAPTGEE